MVISTVNDVFTQRDQMWSRQVCLTGCHGYEKWAELKCNSAWLEVSQKLLPSLSLPFNMQP